MSTTSGPVLTIADLVRVKGMLEGINANGDPAMIDITERIIAAFRPYRPDLHISLGPLGLVVRPADEQQPLPLGESA